MFTLQEIQILVTIVGEWQDRTPMKVFVMGSGGHLQSALTKLQQLAVAIKADEEAEAAKAAAEAEAKTEKEPSNGNDHDQD